MASSVEPRVRELYQQSTARLQADIDRLKQDVASLRSQRDRLAQRMSEVAAAAAAEVDRVTAELHEERSQRAQDADAAAAAAAAAEATRHRLEVEAGGLRRTMEELEQRERRRVSSLQKQLDAVRAELSAATAAPRPAVRVDADVAITPSNAAYNRIAALQKEVEEWKARVGTPDDVAVVRHQLADQAAEVALLRDTVASQAAAVRRCAELETAVVCLTAKLESHRALVREYERGSGRVLTPSPTHPGMFVEVSGQRSPHRST